MLLAQPFKAVRIGPVSMFVEDVASSERFYTDTLGLKVTEETVVEGHRCVFLRADTEHHSIGLFPIELRAALGLNDRTTLLTFGVQLGSYQQLRHSVAFLQEKGAKLVDLPQDIHPGIDYFAVGPVDPTTRTSCSRRQRASPAPWAPVSPPRLGGPAAVMRSGYPTRPFTRITGGENSMILEAVPCHVPARR